MTPVHPLPPLLDYRVAGPRARYHSRVARLSLLFAAILAIHVAALLVLNPVIALSEALGGGALGTPFAPIDPTLSQSDIQRRYLPRALAYFALFLLTQYLFMTPRGRWRISLAPDAPPSRRSAVAAGFIGMLLSIGLLATLFEIPDWWIKLTTKGGADTPQHFAPLWPVMLAVWTAWALLFHSYFHSLDRYTALAKVLRWLVAGTVLELVIAAPVHAYVLSRRGEHCYCQRGSWTGIAFGATAALWVFGPGAFLLFLRERRRRENLI